MLDIPDFLIDNVTYSNVRLNESIPSVSEDISCRLNHAVTMSQKRAIIPVNLISKVHFIPADYGERKTNFMIPYAYTDYDTLRYLLPEDLVPERIPGPVHIESPFGIYDAKLEIEEGAVVYMRMVSSEKGVFPATLYKQYVDYRKKIQQADNRKLLLNRKTQ